VEVIDTLLYEDIDALVRVLEGGGDPNATSDGRSLLCAWFESPVLPHPDLLRVLVEYGADLNAHILLYGMERPDLYITPLNCLIDGWVMAKRSSYGKDIRVFPEVLVAMIELGANPYEATLSAYGQAALYGYASILETLHGTGFPIELPVGLRVGPVPLVTMAKNKRIAETLVRWGADPLQRDSIGRNPLFFLLDTVERSPVHMNWKVAPVSLLRYLIKMGNDPHERGNQNESLIHAAANGGNPKALSYLLKIGLRAQDRDHVGDTPLHYAVRQRWLALIEGGLDVIDLLIEAGLHPDTPNSDGLTPLQLAILLHRTGAATRLLEMGANSNLPYPDGRTLQEVFKETYGEEAFKLPLGERILGKKEKVILKPSVPERVRYVKELAKKLKGVPFSKTEVILIYPAPELSARNHIMRLGGKPVGVTQERWPTAPLEVLKRLYAEHEGSLRGFKRWLKGRGNGDRLPMEHLLTLDLTLLSTPPKGVPPGAKTLSVFLPVLEFGLGEYLADKNVPSEDFYALVYGYDDSSEEWEDGGAVPLLAEKVEVPHVIFTMKKRDRAELSSDKDYGEILPGASEAEMDLFLTLSSEKRVKLLQNMDLLKRALFQNSYAGGYPMYVQREEGDLKSFIMQFSEEITEWGELVWINFGMAIYYVFSDRMFGQAM